VTDHVLDVAVEFARANEANIQALHLGEEVLVKESGGPCE
jgi:hypothetical protein